MIGQMHVDLILLPVFISCRMLSFRQYIMT